MAASFVTGTAARPTKANPAAFARDDNKSCHFMASGLSGLPTAPVNRKGGATKKQV